MKPLGCRPGLIIFFLVLTSSVCPVSSRLSCDASSIAGLLQQHATQASCWATINYNGQVRLYDITRLTRDHEGGNGLIWPLCGKDATFSTFCTTDHDADIMDDAAEDGLAQLVCSYSDPTVKSISEQRANCKSPTPPTPPSTTIPGADVPAHANIDDCWTVVQGAVYDLTKYIRLHPGGTASVLAMCGRDSTASFTAKHPLGYLGAQSTITVLGTVSGTVTLPKPQAPPPGTPSVDTARNLTNLPLILPADLASHNMDNDCWIATRGGVYDVTTWRKQVSFHTTTSWPSRNVLLLRGLCRYVVPEISCFFSMLHCVIVCNPSL